MLVTRPQPGAEPDGGAARRSRLRAGRAAAHAKSCRLSRRLPDGDVAALVVSSANAIRHAPAELVRISVRTSRSSRSATRRPQRQARPDLRMCGRAPAMPPISRATSRQACRPGRGSPISAGACGWIRWRRSLPSAASTSSAIETYDTPSASPDAGRAARARRRRADRRGAGLFGQGRRLPRAAGVAARGNDLSRHRVHLHLAARRQGTGRLSRAGVCLRPKRRMKTPCSTFLPEPGHDPAPFSTNLA